SSGDAIERVLKLPLGVLEASVDAAQQLPTFIGQQAVPHDKPGRYVVSLISSFCCRAEETANRTSNIGTFMPSDFLPPYSMNAVIVHPLPSLKKRAQLPLQGTTGNIRLPGNWIAQYRRVESADVEVVL